MSILSNIALVATIIFLFFIPGFFMLRAVFGSSKIFYSLENLALSFATSITIVDILMLVMGRVGIPFSRGTLIFTILAFIAICISIMRYRSKSWKTLLQRKPDTLSFSKRQSAILVILLFLTIFIKADYLSQSVIPSSTDLGHHMYWTKLIAVNQTLPVYEEADINMETSELETLPIADFIIGEHLPFAALSLVSGIDVVSSFPISFLLIINIFSSLAIFIFALTVFSEHKHGKTIALIALMLIGPLWAIASPQAKFVSGGVIGNTIGNLFIPLIFYSFYRAFMEKNQRILALAIFLGIGMAYTHHLSTFVSIFICFFAAVWYIATNLKSILPLMRQWIKFLFNPYVLSAIILGIVLVLFIYVPTYLNAKAVGTAVGTPVKSTRIGLTFAQLSQTGGYSRMALAIAGMILLAVLPSRRSISSAFLIGWLGSLLIMSLKPNLLFIDIPSNRIASYIIFPLSIIGAYAFIQILSRFSHNQTDSIKPAYSMAIFFFFVSFAATGGLFENSQFTAAPSNNAEILQMRNASKYLAQRTDQSDGIIKDHNYLTADSWMKLYFMRGYTYPLSRGYFKRYEDETKPREKCTLNMISLPNTPEGRLCFEKTGTDFVMINPKFDSPQFSKSKDFIPAYIADDIAIYYRTAN